MSQIISSMALYIGFSNNKYRCNKKKREISALNRQVSYIIARNKINMKSDFLVYHTCFVMYDHRSLYFRVTRVLFLN